MFFTRFSPQQSCSPQVLFLLRVKGAERLGVLTRSRSATSPEMLVIPRPSRFLEAHFQPISHTAITQERAARRHRRTNAQNQSRLTHHLQALAVGFAPVHRDHFTAGPAVLTRVHQVQIGSVSRSRSARPLPLVTSNQKFSFAFAAVKPQRPM